MRLGLWLLFYAAVCTALPAQTNRVAEAAPVTRYTWNAVHDPNGRGKFYLGREIALVMGHEGADWLERPERDREEHTSVLVDSLELRPGDVVADIGCGTGYFSRRIAPRLGVTGKVLAVDIQPEMLHILTNSLAGTCLTNIVPVLGTEKRPNLPPDSVDLALLVDVYHEFEYPYEMMSAITEALKPQGRVVVVEYRGEDPRVPIKEVHKMTEAQVRLEFEQLPLRWVRTVGTLPQQHILVFEKTAAPDPGGQRQSRPRADRPTASP